MKYFEGFKSLPPIQYLIFSLLIIFCLEFLIDYIFDYFNISGKEIGFPNLKKRGFTESMFLVAIVAPLLESFIYQYLVINTIQFLAKKKNFNNTKKINFICIIISTILFASAHLSYSIWYFLAMLPAGFFLAFTYLNFKGKTPNGFWMIVFLHSLHNAISILLSEM